MGQEASREATQTTPPFVSLEKIVTNLMPTKLMNFSAYTIWSGMMVGPMWHRKTPPA